SSPAQRKKASFPLPSSAAVRCIPRTAMHLARFPRKALEEALPAGGRIEDFADHSRLLAETVKVSVLKLDPCPVHTVGNEMNLQFGDQIRVEAPVLTDFDLPSEQQAAGRLPCQDLTPLAFAAVFPALEPTSVNLRLEHDVLNRRCVDAVLFIPPVRHPRSEDIKSPIRRDPEVDALAHR